MKDGQPQRLDRRLFMQFLAFGGCTRTRGWSATRSTPPACRGVVYEDVNDPRGIGLLTFSDDPDFFLDRSGRCSTASRSRRWCRSPSTRCSAGRTRSATSRT